MTKQPMISRRQLVAYAVATLLPFVALIKLCFDSLDDHAFLLGLAPIMVSGWIGGLGPAVLTAIISAILSCYYFVPPVRSFAVAEPVPFIVFIAESVVLCVLTEAHHRSRRRAAALLGEVERQNAVLRESDRQLRAAHQEIERRSQARLAEHAAGRDRAEKALRSTEDQLRHAQKMEAVGRLAGGIAHDFNNMMAVVLSYCTLITERLAADDPLRDDIGEIEKAGQRARDLTAQLLAFTRQQVLQPRVVDMNEIVSDMETMIRRLVGDDVEFATALASEPALVDCDPGQIGQVIMNLVVNARDAMPNGGRLTITTRQADVDIDEAHLREHPDALVGRRVLVAVRDSGVGMDEATKTRMFEPFFTTKEVGKGTGLGLSTVYGIVKQSGGTISVSTELAKGTTIAIYLPSADRTRAASAIRTGSPDEALSA